MKRVDTLTYDLCEEIDELKEAVKYWQLKYQEERDLNIRTMNESLESAKKGVANALKFCLSVTDSPNGDLVISKEKRKELAKSYKS